jgi:hypothetical protein
MKDLKDRKEFIVTEKNSEEKKENLIGIYELMDLMFVAEKKF